MSEISKFYLDKTVLVTGATGFLGQMTVEKLLRSCDTKKIFVVFRPKAERTVEQRLKTYFDSPMFANLAEQKPDFQRKVEVLEGDIQYPKLGLKPEDLQKIMREVEVIFHWAATVNFTENFKVATNTNVKPVRDLIIIAREMPQLKSFLYVSTAYSHCIIKEIHETFYDDTMDGKDLITCMDSLNEKTADDITPGLLGDWPNTYVYTKSAAENIVKTEGIGLPIGIYRPSIITAAYNEPMPGWLGNLYGYTSLLIGLTLGYIRVVFADPKLKPNLVPADYVVNSAIAAAWETSQKDQNEMLIYNFTDTNAHSLENGEIERLSHILAIKVPPSKIVWHHTMCYTTNRLMFKILDYLLHYLPAKLMDLICVCVNNKPIYLKIYTKAQKMANVYLYFTAGQWNFHNGNIVRLWNSMSETDKKLFEFDMSALDWNEYIYRYFLGIKLYVYKETLDSIPAAKRRVLKMKIIHHIVQAFFLFVLYYVVTSIFNILM